MNAIVWKIAARIFNVCDGRLEGVANCNRERGHGGRCSRSAWPRVEWERR